MPYPDAVLRWSIRAYLFLFFTYLLFPLAYMLLLAFNDSRIPTHRNFIPTFKWFGVQTSFEIAVFVVILSTILGLGGAIMLTRLQIRAKSLLYAVLVSPILA